jgi:hypothetical protein
MHIQTAVDNFDEKNPQRYKDYVLQTNLD